MPADEATWKDIQTVFGKRGDPARCQCQRFKMHPGESWASVGAAELGRRLREQTHCGRPEADTTCGLVATSTTAPSGGAPSSRAVHTDGCGRRGISYALARASVDFARRRRPTIRRVVMRIDF